MKLFTWLSSPSTRKRKYASFFEVGKTYGSKLYTESFRVPRRCIAIDHDGARGRFDASPTDSDETNWWVNNGDDFFEVKA